MVGDALNSTLRILISHSGCNDLASRWAGLIQGDDLSYIQFLAVLVRNRISTDGRRQGTSRTNQTEQNRTLKLAHVALPLCKRA